MKHILVLNGPNLNFLGRREPEIYGHETLDDICTYLKNTFQNEEVTLEFYQSNSEGALIDAIQNAYGKMDGIVFNAGAYTHTSVALADAISSVSIPCVEVHLSNVFKREEFRHHSYLSPVCAAQLCGMGKFGYVCAIRYLLEG